MSAAMCTEEFGKQEVSKMFRTIITLSLRALEAGEGNHEQLWAIAKLAHSTAGKLDGGCSSKV